MHTHGSLTIVLIQMVSRLLKKSLIVIVDILFRYTQTKYLIICVELTVSLGERFRTGTNNTIYDMPMIKREVVKQVRQIE